MSRLLIKGEVYEPVKVGDDGDWYAGEPNATCGDCGEVYGKQHAPLCDVERCPLCGGQLLSCDCGPVYDLDENIDKKSLQALIEKQKQDISHKDMVVEFDRSDPSGTIYAVLVSAQERLAKYKPEFDFCEVTKRVCACKSYDDALNVIGEYVTLVDISSETEM